MSPPACTSTYGDDAGGVRLVWTLNGYNVVVITWPDQTVSVIVSGQQGLDVNHKTLEDARIDILNRLASCMLHNKNP
jgi:hypothetical protein